MSDENSKKETDIETIGWLSIRLLENVPRLVSLLISLTALAYITGWIQARAYFSSFGAEWIVSELSSIKLLQFSWIPLIYFCYFVWLGIQDLEYTKENKSSRRWRATTKVLKYGLFPLLFLVILQDILFSHGYEIASQIVGFTAWISCIFFAGAAFEGLLILAYKKAITWEAADLKLVVAIILFGLYFSPTIYGKITGRKDSNPIYSNLPIVETIKEDNYDLRLVLISGDNAFTVILYGGNPKNTEVRILNLSDIISIKRRILSKNEKG